MWDLQCLQKELTDFFIIKPFGLEILPSNVLPEVGERKAKEKVPGDEAFRDVEELWWDQCRK